METATNNQTQAYLQLKWKYGTKVTTNKPVNSTAKAVTKYSRDYYEIKSFIESFD